MTAAADSRAFNGLGTGLTRNEVQRAWTGPIAANVNLPSGSLAGALLADTNTSPVIYPFLGDGTMRALGFVKSGFNNTGGPQGARLIQVSAQSGKLVDKNAGGGSAITQADAYLPAYGADNQTASKLSGDGYVIGMIMGLDSDGVPVFLVDPFIAAVFAAVSTVVAPLAVNQGGSGKTSWTAHKLLAGNGTSAPTELAVGTTGQFLGAITGADPAMRALLASDMPGESGVYRAFKSLTNVQVKALHGTPVEVIPVPGAGKYLEIVSFQAYLVYGSAAFDSVGATDYLELRYTSGAGALLVDTVAPTGFGDATADAYLNVRPATSFVPANANVVAYIAGSEWFAAAGDSTMNIVVLYRIRTLAPVA